MRPCLPRLVLLVAVLAAGGAHADDEDARRTQWNAYLDGVAAELRASAAPRDAALAATLYRTAGPTVDAPALLGRAAATAPDDRLVQWLFLTHDAASSRTGLAPPYRLTALEPDNAAVWFALFGAAAKADDVVEAERMLERMASSPRFDDYVIASTDAWSRVFERRPPPPDPAFDEEGDPAPDALVPEARVFSAALMQASGPPLPWRTLVEFCDASWGGLGGWRRYANCAQAGARMAAANTVLARLFGYIVLRKSALASAADRQALRDLQWRQSMARAFYDDMTDAALARRFLADWRETGDEVEVWRRRIGRAGLSTTAPPGWPFAVASWADAP